MNLAKKYDALLERFMALEDDNKQLRAAIVALHGCATPRELKELDQMVAEHGDATDCARGIMITPAAWGKITAMLVKN